jgi:hypothetical protein
MITIEVVDWYDGDREVIGIAHSFSEAAAIRNARYEDTDDEADVNCYMGGECVDHIVSLYSPCDDEDY